MRNFMAETLVKDLLRHKIIKKEQEKILREAIEDLDLRFSLGEKNELLKFLKNGVKKKGLEAIKEETLKELVRLESLESGGIVLTATIALFEVDAEALPQKEEIILKTIFLFALKHAREYIGEVGQ